ncbi:MAG: hypothetical protein JWM11_4592, partial [Planctomycetaceae bacterium]|nr:hypothetical protein [Planctomycetaceae bacterium]
MSLSQDTCEAPARQARCFGEDRWAELDRIHGVGSEPNEEQQALAKRFSVPSWVVQHKLIEYVLAARHFAKCGEWPDGI